MRITLRAARINKGLTQAELARLINVSKKTVCSWENGKTMPNCGKIKAICDVLGTSYDDIRWKV